MKDIYLKDYIKPNFIIPNVKLYINILDDKTVVDSYLTVKRDTQDKKVPMILDGKDLELQEIEINGEAIQDYDYSSEKLTINNLPDEFVLYTQVVINPYNNKSMEGLYKSGNILCSQNEAEGFRRITFFTDRPDVMSKYTISIEGERSKYPLLLGNGNLVKSEDLGNGRFVNMWEDPFAKPCYLVAIVAGELDMVSDTFTTITGRNIKLEIYTDPGKSLSSKHAMESLKKSMQWDEEVFGLEYDLDTYMIVAVDSFNAGAMENKGLNIFNSAYVLANPETATDSDFEGVEGVIAHEYFHNWTGNRVTCRDWFQLTLKEGLTVFRDQEFSSDMTDRTVKRILDVSTLRNFQFTEDMGPNAHPIKPKSYIKIDNFYTATVYEKGAEIIRMIHTLIGKDNFRKGMDLYFERHTGCAVTTEDFVSAMSDASNTDLSQFRRWYSQAGTPTLDIDSQYKDGVYTLKIKQNIPKTSYDGPREPLYFPFKVGLYGTDGQDLTPINADNLIISKIEEEFNFKTGQKVIPSLLQDFSAPVIVNYEYTLDELITLLNADKDNFNRFDASRRIAMISVVKILDDIKMGNKCSIDSRIINSFKKILLDSSIEKRYLASLIFIPEIKNIVSTMKEYDYQLANNARTTYIKILVQELKSELFRVFEDNLREKYTYSKKAVAERTLKNKVLSLLCYLGDDIAEIAQKQFETTDNMTDYLAAYSALQMCSDEVREKANIDFYTKWKDNFLVMNKWFAVQANRDNKNIINEIKILSQNPIFDKTNPNMIRSLYRVFASVNLPNFHLENGDGYKVISDIIIELDGYNSHASASLAGTFQTYKYLPVKQAKLMKEQLTKILSKKDISLGLFEIISKTINARS